MTLKISIMLYKFTISLIFISTFIFGQKCESDTTINRLEFFKIKQLVVDCDDEMTQSLNKIKILENIIDEQKKRIKFLEDLVVNRKDWIIKKCPKFKKSKRRRKLS